MSNEEQDQRLRQSQRAYVGFLDDGEQDGHYDSLIKEMIANKSKRLVVNINDIRRALPERAKSLIENAGDEIVALQVNPNSNCLTVVLVSTSEFLCTVHTAIHKWFI